VIEELAQAGIEEFILVVSPGKELLASHFRPHPELEAALAAKGKNDLLALVKKTSALGKITLAQQEKPLGLGHAVLCAREAVGEEPFIVALADDLVDAQPTCAEQLVANYERFQKPQVAVFEVPDSDVNKYGIVAPRYSPDDPRYALDPEKRLLPLKELQEKPSVAAAASRLAIVGRYLLTPDIFPLLAKTEKGVGGEIQLTDGLRALNRQRDLLAYRFHGERFDSGDKLGFLAANVHFALKGESGPAFRVLLERELKRGTR
jgi:UTP--glucose-1-phosphate uridylyltransferase